MLEKSFIVSRNGLSLTTEGGEGGERILEFINSSESDAAKLENVICEAAILHVYTGKSIVELVSPLLDTLPEKAKEFVGERLKGKKID